MITAFALSSGRSGTHFLYELLRRNAVDCESRHETYHPRNKSMFGRAIYDYAVGDLDAVRRRAATKVRWILGRRAPAYVETSHSFLKSWFEVAPGLLPDLRLVHLVRDATKVALSEANRHLWLDRRRLPFRYVRVGGVRFFRWALTGREPIFEHVRHLSLSLFQRYFVQWIEIENRALRMLDRFQLHDRCFTIRSPHDLNDEARVGELFDWLGVRRRSERLDMGGFQNKTPGAPTIVTDAHHAEAREVVDALPDECLRIFRRPPYVEMAWASLLRREDARPAADRLPSAAPHGG